MAIAPFDVSTAGAHGLCYCNLSELRLLLDGGKISATELLEHAIARIEKLDRSINAIVVRDFERARAAAQTADSLLRSGDSRPLLGVPITVKESFNVTGLPTTWGFPDARNYRPASDALVVQRLKAAGAIIIGKTNVPLAISDWQSFNDIYGTTNNPWNIACSPGGSSGGSAAALAAGFVALEIGSDLRGSMRVPAHYCGIYAHKPTHGIVPLRGHIPPGVEALATNPDLAVAGPMARCAQDLGLALDVIAGPDDAESIGCKFDMPGTRHDALREYRVLVVGTHPLMPTSSEISGSLDRMADRLAGVGAKVFNQDKHLPSLEETARTYTKLFTSFAAASWSAQLYDEVRLVVAAGAGGIDTPRTRRANAAVLSHRDWIIADRIRASLRKQWQDLFRDFDVILCPTMPTPALSHDHLPDQEGRRISIDGNEWSYADQDLWLTIASLTGLPSTVAPIGRSKLGLPIGMQIIGPHMGDRTTIKFAALVEELTGNFLPPSELGFA